MDAYIRLSIAELSLSILSLQNVRYHRLWFSLHSDWASLFEYKVIVCLAQQGSAIKIMPVSKAQQETTALITTQKQDHKVSDAVHVLDGLESVLVFLS